MKNQSSRVEWHKGTKAQRRKVRCRFAALPLCLLLSLLGSGCMDKDVVQTRGNVALLETTAKNLRCEYRIDPLGIDLTRPRLSWVLDSRRRFQKQTAYQILVAGSEKDLVRNRGRLWDTGKVKSDRSSQVVYEGKPLKSRMHCYWKVRVWDKDDRASAWSEPAMWTVGLLEPKDWQAKWIGYDAEPPASYKSKDRPEPPDVQENRWVWFDEGDPQQSHPTKRSNERASPWRPTTRLCFLSMAGRQARPKAGRRFRCSISLSSSQRRT
ncbi:MAG: glycoside hydrolase family 78 protein [Planctomycetota bacterium]